MSQFDEDSCCDVHHRPEHFSLLALEPEDRTKMKTGNRKMGIREVEQ
jgi:hypothetical protein